MQSGRQDGVSSAGEGVGMVGRGATAGCHQGHPERLRFCGKMQNASVQVFAS